MFRNPRQANAGLCIELLLNFLEVSAMLKKKLDEVSRQRVRAGRLLQKGKKQAEIAHATGVAR